MKYENWKNIYSYVMQVVDNMNFHWQLSEITNYFLHFRQEKMTMVSETG